MLRLVDLNDSVIYDAQIRGKAYATLSPDRPADDTQYATLVLIPGIRDTLYATPMYLFIDTPTRYAAVLTQPSVVRSVAKLS